jgi:N-acetylglucosamine-6-sulfatase
VLSEKLGNPLRGIKLLSVAIAMALMLLVAAPSSAQSQADPTTAGLATENGQGASILDLRGDLRGSGKKRKRPNIVVLQTDDQTVQDTEVMPKVKRLLQDRGVTFDQMITPFAICCPSRAAQMTGSYPHNNGVSANFPPAGGFVPWEKKSGDKAIGQWLKNSGYHTVHIGKYINGYAFGNRRDAKVPKGWSEWHGSTDPSTYQMWGYRVNGPNGSRKYGKFPIEDPRKYSTDVYRKKAVKVVRQQAKQPGPFYMQVAFLAPHVETVPIKGKLVPESWADVDNPDPSTGIVTIPPRPAPRDRNAFNNMPLEEDPSFNEADVSDKQEFVRNLPLLTDDDIAELVEDNRQRRRSLLAVDDAVKSVVASLKKTGQYRNTIIVMMGDNGYLLGQHRISMGKYFPYEPALRIPFVMSGPGIKRGVNVGDLVSVIDLAPTLLDFARTKATGRQPDGKSLRRLLADKPVKRQRTVLLSSGPQRAPNGEYLPQFGGVRSPHYAWWRYDDNFEEMYDLRQDPYQLGNVAGDPAYASVRERMIAKWDQLKDCYGKTCRRPGLSKTS